jgi:hypothetical protein
MPLFHVSSARLSVGHILNPGEWGRRTREFRRGGRALVNVHDAVNLAWEASLETARRSHAPNAPSRLDCVFTCQTLDDARAYRTRFVPSGTIYEVEPISTCPIAADYDLITDTGSEPFLDLWVTRSIRYWTSEPQDITEVLVGGDVRVVRVVE